MYSMSSSGSLSVKFGRLSSVVVVTVVGTFGFGVPGRRRRRKRRMWARDTGCEGLYVVADGGSTLVSLLSRCGTVTNKDDELSQCR